jgi:hypothetical protein
MEYVADMRGRSTMVGDVNAIAKMVDVPDMLHVPSTVVGEKWLVGINEVGGRPG